MKPKLRHRTRLGAALGTGAVLVLAPVVPAMASDGADEMPVVEVADDVTPGPDPVPGPQPAPDPAPEPQPGPAPVVPAPLPEPGTDVDPAGVSGASTASTGSGVAALAADEPDVTGAVAAGAVVLTRDGVATDLAFTYLTTNRGNSDRVGGVNLSGNGQGNWQGGKNPGISWAASSDHRSVELTVNADTQIGVVVVEVYNAARETRWAQIAIPSGLRTGDTLTVSTIGLFDGAAALQHVWFYPGEASPEPTDPINPTDPTEPTDPTNPTDPTEPTDPTNPTDPTEPTEPTDPTNPTDPADPGDPSDPTNVPGVVTDPPVTEVLADEDAIDPIVGPVADTGGERIGTSDSVVAAAAALGALGLAAAYLASRRERRGSES